MPMPAARQCTPSTLKTARATASIESSVTASTGARPSSPSSGSDKARYSVHASMPERCLQHGLGQPLLDRIELPIGQLAAARPDVQRQQPAPVNVLVDLLADLVRQPGELRQRQVVRLIEASSIAARPRWMSVSPGAQRLGARRAAALRARLRCTVVVQTPPRRTQALDPLQPFVHEHLQFGRKGLGVAYLHGVGKAAHSSDCHPGQAIGDELHGVGHERPPVDWNVESLISFVYFVNLEPMTASCHPLA